MADELEILTENAAGTSWVDLVPGDISTGYQAQNTNIEANKNGFDASSMRWDSGTSELVFDESGVIDEGGLPFVTKSEARLAIGGAGTKYIKLNAGSTSLLRSFGFASGAGTWDASKNGYYESGDRVLDWVIAYSGSGTPNIYRRLNVEDGTGFWTDILYAGQAGIGTDLPKSILDINSDDPVLTITNNQVTITDTEVLGSIEWYSEDTTLVGGSSNLSKIECVAEENFSGANANKTALTFFTTIGGSSSEIMRINSSGQVGIGTGVNIDSLLHIQGTVNAAFTIESPDSAGGFSEIIFKHGGVSQWEIESFPDSHSSFAGKFAIRDAGAAERRLVIDSSGNIGIGTTSPVVRLHVEGGTFRVRPNTGTDNGALYHATDNSNAYLSLYDSSGVVAVLLNARDGFDSYINAGDFGLGTTTPAQNLDIYEDIDNNMGINIENPNAGTGADARINFENDNGNRLLIRLTSSNFTTFGEMGRIETVGSIPLIFGTAGTENLRIDTGGDLVYTATDFKIQADTLDGSDNKRLLLESAGAASVTRGAYVTLAGNEYATNPGSIFIVAGDTGTEFISLYTDSTEAYKVDNSLRHLYQVRDAVDFADSTKTTHPFTDFLLSDNFAKHYWLNGTTAGYGIRAASSGDTIAFQLDAFLGSTNPTDTIPAIRLVGHKSDGSTGVANLADDEDVFEIFNSSSKILYIEGNGSMYLNGGRFLNGSNIISSNGTITQNTIFDTLISFVPNSGDRMIASGSFVYAPNGDTIVISCFDYNSSSSVLIRGFDITSGLIFQEICNNGSSTNFIDGGEFVW